jgi:hypothetical protein
MRKLLVLVACFGLGCASLAWDYDDGVAAKTGKTLVRVPLGVVTLGISEVAIADAKDNRRVGRYITLLRSQMSQAEIDFKYAKTDQERELAQWKYNRARDDLQQIYQSYRNRQNRMQTMGAALSNAGAAMRSTNPPPAQSQPPPPPPPPVHCSTMVHGEVISTTCY